MICDDIEHFETYFYNTQNLGCDFPYYYFDFMVKQKSLILYNIYNNNLVMMALGVDAPK